MRPLTHRAILVCLALNLALSGVMLWQAATLHDRMHRTYQRVCIVEYTAKALHYGTDDFSTAGLQGCYDGFRSDLGKPWEDETLR